MSGLDGSVLGRKMDAVLFHHNLAPNCQYVMTGICSGTWWWLHPYVCSIHLTDACHITICACSIFEFDKLQPMFTLGLGGREKLELLDDVTFQGREWKWMIKQRGVWSCFLLIDVDLKALKEEDSHSSGDSWAAWLISVLLVSSIFSSLLHESSFPDLRHNPLIFPSPCPPDLVARPGKHLKGYFFLMYTDATTFIRC